MPEEAFKIVGLVSEDGRATEWLCKSHLTKKWDNRFAAPVDPSLDKRACTLLWQKYTPALREGRRLEVHYSKIIDGMPYDISHGVLVAG